MSACRVLRHRPAPARASSQQWLTACPMGERLRSMSAVSHPATPSCFRLTGFPLLVDFRYASPRRTTKAPTPCGRTLGVTSLPRSPTGFGLLPPDTLWSPSKNLPRRPGSRFSFGTLWASVNRVRGKSKTRSIKAGHVACVHVQRELGVQIAIAFVIRGRCLFRDRK